MECYESIVQINLKKKREETAERRLNLSDEQIRKEKQQAVERIARKLSKPIKYYKPI